ncbi:MAG: penicillin-binding protein 1B [Gammaproteobacteria bacterium]
MATRTARAWLIFYACVIAVAVLLGYCLWLDRIATARFAGARWALPARVYARPLELYEGRRIQTGALAAELARLGYRRVQSVSGPGEYAVAGGTVAVHTRGFQFWDGAQAGRFVQLDFEGEVVTRVGARDGGPNPPLVRLDPVEIAQIVPHDREDRILLRRSEIPQSLVDALLSAEDRRFYSHPGIDPLAIARAMLVNLRHLRLVQGGSTLTQQLAKNFFLTEERTLRRKFNDALLALLLERRFGKDEILEAYVNEIFLGQDGDRAIHGFGLAARFYFGRPIDELPVEQVATLVAMVPGPTAYDPRSHPQRCLARRNLVLRLMVEQGRLSAADAAHAARRPLGLAARAPRTAYPAFLDYLRAVLVRDYRDEDLRTEGLRIFTTLDPRLQEIAERRLAAGLAGIEARPGSRVRKLQGAMLVTDIGTAEVLAIVGGREARFAGYNRVTAARRPIGSLVKPAVYLAALREPHRYSVVTALEDAPISMRDGSGRLWQPHNYDRRVHGRVQLRDAIAYSLNLATIRLGLDVGYDAVLAALSDLGFATRVPRYPSLFLGAIEQSVIDVARFYQTIANGGFRSDFRPIREVTTAAGKPLARYDIRIESTVAPAHAWLLRYLLGRVAQQGTARAAGEALAGMEPLGGKTGTTNDLRDAWFAGFAGNLLAVVWVGRDDNRPVGLTGATGALPIWIEFMTRAAPTAAEPEPPEDIEWYWIDGNTGRGTEPGCENAQRVPFVAGAPPQEYEPCTTQDASVLPQH